MFVKRKWARMGSIFKLYIRIYALVLVAILVLSFHSWKRKQNLMLHLKTTILDPIIKLKGISHFY